MSVSCEVFMFFSLAQVVRINVLSGVFIRLNPVRFIKVNTFVMFRVFHILCIYSHSRIDNN